MEDNFKSAVAFFFLFFLTGFSFGNGQQGISYNNCIYAIPFTKNGKLENKSTFFGS